MMEHPARDERAAAADDVHHAPLVLHVRNRRARHAAVQREKVRAVLRLLLDHVEEVVIRHLDHRTVPLDRNHRRLVERHRPDHDWRMRNDPLPREIDIVPRRQIHHRIRAAAHRLVQFFQLRLDVGEHIRCPDIRIYLHAQPRAHTART